MLHVSPVVLAGMLTLIELQFEIARERHGPDWCRKKLVGRAREKLASRTHVVAIGAEPMSSDEVGGRKWAADRLAKHCRNCGGCPMGRE